MSGNIRSKHLHILVRAPAYYSPAKIVQYLKGKSPYRLQIEFLALRKRYWGSHLWNRGYFCAAVGAVTEEQVQKYIADQSEGDEAFTVWDEVYGVLPEIFD